VSVTRRFSRERDGGLRSRYTRPTELCLNSDLSDFSDCPDFLSDKSQNRIIQDLQDNTGLKSGNACLYPVQTIPSV